MATNKIKFKMSIEKIEFEFEGDYEHGKSIQQGITHTLGGLSNVQNRAMGLDDTNSRKLIESKIVDQAPVRRRKKRRFAAIADEGDNKIKAGNKEEAERMADGEQIPRRSTGISPMALVLDLRRLLFFETPRTAGDIKDELHRKGFSSIRASDLTYPLLQLTQKDVLRRDKDQQRNQWAYSNGTNDELK